MTDAVAIDSVALDVLMPMHLRYDRQGIIRHAGRVLRQVSVGRELIGLPLAKAFHWTRPSTVSGLTDLADVAGEPLKLRTLAERPVRLRGVLQPLANGAGGLVDLSLDLGDVQDLGGAKLTQADFSPTDPTVDMLYLLEANHAILAESRNLIDRLHSDKSRAEIQAFTDALTGLSNRRALDRLLDRLVDAGDPFALTQVDLDHFKQVNDTHGHAAGDRVLTVAALRLREATRQTDTVARVGGDEFIIVFRGLTDPERLDQIANRIIDQLEEPVVHGSAACRISASLGTAISTHYTNPSIERMMEDADRALYAAKQAGRAAHRIHVTEGNTPASPRKSA